jgi:hypothetical protein
MISGTAPAKIDLRDASPVVRWKPSGRSSSDCKTCNSAVSRESIEDAIGPDYRTTDASRLRVRAVQLHGRECFVFLRDDQVELRRVVEDVVGEHYKETGRAAV